AGGLVEPGLARHEDRDADGRLQPREDLLRLLGERVDLRLRPVSPRPVAAGEGIDAVEDGDREEDRDGGRAAPLRERAHGVSFFDDSTTVERNRKSAIPDR